MGTTIRTPNFDTANLKAFTSMNADVAAGSNSISPRSWSDLVTGDYVVLGSFGGPTTEMFVIGTPGSSTPITGGPTLYLHKVQEQVTSLNANAVKLYSAAVPSDGSLPADTSFAALGIQGTINVQQLYTDLYDPNGGSTYWYKVTYVNTSTGWESNLADSVAVIGDDANHYVSLDDIRKETGLKEMRNIEDTIVSFQRDAAEAEVNGQIASLLTLPLTYPYPPIIVTITRQLAAGLLLLNQYGITENMGAKDGTLKTAEARATLNALVERTMTIVDYRGVPLSVQTIVNGWPDSTTATYNENDDLLSENDAIGGPREFHINKIF